MARYVAEVTTTRSQDEVFAFMSDFRNAPAWDPGTKAARLLNSSAGNQTDVMVGSRFALDVAFGPRTLQAIYEITELHPPNLVVLRADEPWFLSLDRISVRTEGSMTVLTYDAEMIMKKYSAVMSPLMDVMFPRICRRAERRLREVFPS